MKHQDLYCAVAMLALAATVLVATRELEYWADFAPGPAFLPTWVAGLAACLALLLLRRARVPPKAVSEEPDADVPAANTGRVFSTIAGLGLMLVALPLLGLRIATALFMFYMLIVVLGQKWFPSLVATLITVALVQLLFAYWLGIDIPSAIFVS